MMPLMQVAENVAIDLLDGLGLFSDPQVNAMVVQDACRGYAVIASCHLLQRRDLTAYRRWLALGAQAYADWLAVAPAARHTHAHAEPLWYAVLAGDATLATLIHQRLRPGFNHGCEYEEDFAFARILHLLTCAADPSSEVVKLLVFWRSVSGGGEPEFALAEALAARAVDTVRDLLIDRLDQRAIALRQAQRDGSGDPDERLALGRIDLEVATLVTVARHRLHLDLAIEHRLLPLELVPTVWSPTSALPPRAWCDEERYHLYRDS